VHTDFYLFFLLCDWRLRPKLVACIKSLYTVWICHWLRKKELIRFWIISLSNHCCSPPDTPSASDSARRARTNFSPPSCTWSHGGSSTHLIWSNQVIIRTGRKQLTVYVYVMPSGRRYLLAVNKNTCMELVLIWTKKSIGRVCDSRLPSRRRPAVPARLLQLSVVISAQFYAWCVQRSRGSEVILLCKSGPADQATRSNNTYAPVDCIYASQRADQLRTRTTTSSWSPSPVQS